MAKYTQVSPTNRVSLTDDYYIAAEVKGVGLPNDTLHVPVEVVDPRVVNCCVEVECIECVGESFWVRVDMLYTRD